MKQLSCRRSSASSRQVSVWACLNITSAAFAGKCRAWRSSQASNGISTLARWLTTSTVERQLYNLSGQGPSILPVARPFGRLKSPLGTSLLRYARKRELVKDAGVNCDILKINRLNCYTHHDRDNHHTERTVNIWHPLS